MGISHDYHSTGRRRRGGPGGVIRFAGAVAGILLVSFAITAILEHGQTQPEELPTVTANGTAQNILAPLPMQGAADSTTDSGNAGTAAADGTPAVTLEQFGPAVRRREPTASKPTTAASSASLPAVRSI